MKKSKSMILTLLLSVGSLAGYGATNMEEVITSAKDEKDNKHNLAVKVVKTTETNLHGLEVDEENLYSKGGYYFSRKEHYDENSRLIKSQDIAKYIIGAEKSHHSRVSKESSFEYDSRDRLIVAIVKKYKNHTETNSKSHLSLMQEPILEKTHKYTITYNDANNNATHTEYLMKDGEYIELGKSILELNEDGDVNYSDLAYTINHKDVKVVKNDKNGNWTESYQEGSNQQYYYTRTITYH